MQELAKCNLQKRHESPVSVSEQQIAFTRWRSNPMDTKFSSNEDGVGVACSRAGDEGGAGGVSAFETDLSVVWSLVSEVQSEDGGSLEEVVPNKWDCSNQS